MKSPVRLCYCPRWAEAKAGGRLQAGAGFPPEGEILRRFHFHINKIITIPCPRHLSSEVVLTTVLKNGSDRPVSHLKSLKKAKHKTMQEEGNCYGHCGRAELGLQVAGPGRPCLPLTWVPNGRATGASGRPWGACSLPWCYKEVVKHFGANWYQGRELHPRGGS